MKIFRSKKYRELEKMYYQQALIKSSEILALTMKLNELTKEVNLLASELNDLRIKYRKANSSKGGYITKINNLQKELDNANETIKDLRSINKLKLHQRKLNPKK